MIRRHPRLRKERRQTAGFTLTEIAIVIGILAIILGVIWGAASQLLLNHQVHVAAQQLQTIVNNTRGAVIEQGGVMDTGGGALRKALDQQKVFPLDMRGGATGVIFDPWSTLSENTLGSVYVDADGCNPSSVDITGAPKPCFGVTFFDVPQDACIRLIAQTALDGMGIMWVQVNGVAAGEFGGPVGLTLPVPPSVAEARCDNSGVTGFSNDILWIFSIKLTAA